MENGSIPFFFVLTSSLLLSCVWLTYWTTQQSTNSLSSCKLVERWIWQNRPCFSCLCQFSALTLAGLSWVWSDPKHLQDPLMKMRLLVFLTCSCIKKINCESGADTEMQFKKIIENTLGGSHDPYSDALCNGERKGGWDCYVPTAQLW